ncbi:MAG: aspartate aminotransferase family protein [Planctomycetota bacterium]|jgi:glutamate-1-semialdehyde 2,1-aminomutase/spore coat polysaccharide biosynthesis protein SpsF
MEGEKDNSSLKIEYDYFKSRTCTVIPDGVQTLSKMPSKHVEGVYPVFLDRGEGAYVYDRYGNRYIDFPCGLGAVILGHAYGPYNRVVREQLERGLVFSLPHIMETGLAEKICQLFRVDMLRFLKTGSEATSAAVKLSRAYTGRDNLGCCGYHGWHDRYNASTPKNKGCHELAADQIMKLPYNDIGAFIDFVKRHEPAAIIMEPVVLEPPKEDFLQDVRRLCDENGVVLIFDEIVTGFRYPGFSAANYYKVKPDLICLGKAMANGLPISCVAGKREIMEELEGDCFVSSTFGGELLSITAALATIDLMERHNAIEHIWWAGNVLKEDFNRIADGKAECIGLAPRTFFKFPTEAHKSLFWQECLKRGVLFGYAQFVTLSHTADVMTEVRSAMEGAWEILDAHWDDPEAALEGKVAQETFRLVANEPDTTSTLSGGPRMRPPVAQPRPVGTANPVPTDRGNAGAVLPRGNL